MVLLYWFGREIQDWLSAMQPQAPACVLAQHNCYHSITHHIIGIALPQVSGSGRHFSNQIIQISPARCLISEMKTVAASKPEIPGVVLTLVVRFASIDKMACWCEVFSSQAD